MLPRTAVNSKIESLMRKKGFEYIMEKKILVLDLDGTLTNKEKKVTLPTRQAIRTIQEQGHIVVLASGRPTPGVLPVAEELELGNYGGYILSFNGGRIIRCRDGEVLYNQMLPDDIVPEIFAMADELGIGMMTYDSKGILANLHHDEFMELEAFITHLDLHHYEVPMEHFNASVNKCLGTAPVLEAPEVKKKFEARFGHRIHVDRSEPFFIELLPMGVNKAASMERLCEILGLSMDNAIACGDGYNDISMIKAAGFGVAMANAQPPVKEAADYITLSNEEDGVAHVIHKFMLGDEITQQHTSQPTHL